MYFFTILPVIVDNVATLSVVTLGKEKKKQILMITLLVRTTTSPIIQLELFHFCMHNSSFFHINCNGAIKLCKSSCPGGSTGYLVKLLNK